MTGGKVSWILLSGLWVQVAVSRSNFIFSADGAGSPKRTWLAEKGRFEGLTSVPVATIVHQANGVRQMRCVKPGSFHGTSAVFSSLAANSLARNSHAPRISSSSHHDLSPNVSPNAARPQPNSLNGKPKAPVSEGKSRVTRMHAVAFGLPLKEEPRTVRTSYELRL
jgi:hypothetical protein